MALDSSSDLTWPSGADALAPKTPATAKPSPTPPARPEKPAEKPAAPAATDATALAAQLPKVAEDTNKQIQALELEKMQLHPPKMEAPPKPQMAQDPLSEWGRVALTLAAIGGHGARASLTASLNAAASAVKGMKEGNKEAAEQAYKTWEVETRNAETMMRFQADSYKTAMAGITSREEAARVMGTQKEASIKAQLTALSTAFQDPAMAAAAKEGLPHMVDLQQKRVDTEQKFKERTQKIAELKAESTTAGQAGEAYREWKATEEGQKASPQEDINKRAELMEQFNVTKGGKAAQFQPVTPEQQAELADEYVNLRAKIPSTSARARRPGLEEAVQRAYKQDPNLTEADYDIMRGAEKDLTTGKSAQTLKSLYVGARHLDNLQKLADSLPNESGVQLQNKFTAGVEKQFGAPEVTNFETAKEFIGKELVKAITGAGGGVEERKRMGELFSTAETKEQLAGAIKVARDLMAQQYVGVEHQFESLPEPVKKRYFPEDTRKFYELNKPKHEAAQPGEKKGETAPKRAEQGARYGAPRNGKTEPIVVKDGKWVFESDGAPVK